MRSILKLPKNAWEGPQAAILAIAGISAAALLALAISAPLKVADQYALGAVMCISALAIHRDMSRRALIHLLVLSAVASMRYLVWRFNETLDFADPQSAVAGTLLIACEVYVIGLMLISYFQCAWPLGRQPVELEKTPDDLPSVDVFVPTYNESLEIVRQTVLAAMSLDWPANCLRVYVLDDGRRAEFREFAERVGATYVQRPHNRHAKAGNVNHALGISSGELVAIFDCDHVPSANFLQKTVGFFRQDPQLGLVQTPHHFFSPDPFERNLGTFRQIPNEGDLFYGVVQDGNDLWNATFFCGSCAVIRRSALQEIGGLAVETVTEDAHTSLRLQRHGYNTAYLRVPLAAGLATESLSGHIGQRIRWARGMTQILRTDNPLTGPGLSWQQRLCYFSAMAHFLFGLPRLLFLIAPAAYLVLDARIISASAGFLAAYWLPHMILTSIASNRMHGRFRASFWNEVYESVLAVYIVLPTLYALFRPGHGKFNVTAKGGLVKRSHLDRQISRPYLALLILNLGCLGAGMAGLSDGAGDFPTMLLNIFWTCYNVLIICSSFAVASESKQVRRHHRIACDFKGRVTAEDGSVELVQIRDFSAGGLGITPPRSGLYTPGQKLMVEILHEDMQSGALPLRVRMQAGGFIGLEFDALTPEQDLARVRATFARPENWERSWAKVEPTGALESLTGVLRIGFIGLVFIAKESWRVAQVSRIARRLARIKRRLPPRTGGQVPPGYRDPIISNSPIEPARKAA